MAIVDVTWIVGARHRKSRTGMWFAVASSSRRQPLHSRSPLPFLFGFGLRPSRRDVFARRSRPDMAARRRRCVASIKQNPRQSLEIRGD